MDTPKKTRRGEAIRRIDRARYAARHTQGALLPRVEVPTSILTEEDGYARLGHGTYLRDTAVHDDPNDDA